MVIFSMLRLKPCYYERWTKTVSIAFAAAVLMLQLLEACARNFWKHTREIFGNPRAEFLETHAQIFWIPTREIFENRAQNFWKPAREVFTPSCHRRR